VIEQLAQEHGYRAVRFNPYLWPEGEKITNEVSHLQDPWVPGETTNKGERWLIRCGEDD
jgi:hypothetical protein